MRTTALSICGSRNGSRNDFSRGRRKSSMSSFVAKPLRMSKRAMHANPQISLHEIVPPFSSSGGAMIHRLCTDYLILARVFLQDRQWSGEQSPRRPTCSPRQLLYEAELDVAPCSPCR